VAISPVSVAVLYSTFGHRGCQHLRTIVVVFVSVQLIYHRMGGSGEGLLKVMHIQTAIPGHLMQPPQPLIFCPSQSPYLLFVEYIDNE
jgi:hypothetical protein